MSKGSGHMRLWFGPVGELLGTGSDGAPVVGNNDGAGAMVEITDMVEGVTIEPEKGQP